MIREICLMVATANALAGMVAVFTHNYDSASALALLSIASTLLAQQEKK